MSHAGIDGFLPWRASIMLDVVFLVMFLVIPLMAWSIYQVKYRRNYALHKRAQLSLAVVLAVAVTLFEADMQFFSDWRARAAASPYYDAGLVVYTLWVHLVFAVSTAALWIYVIAQALRRFPKPPRPNDYSRVHTRWAKLAAIDMFLTALTGWIFYYLAFIA